MKKTLLPILLVFLTFFCLYDKQPECFPVKLSKSFYPTIKVKIGEIEEDCILSLGSKYPIFKNKEGYTFSKKQMGVSISRNLKGEKENIPLFVFPKVEIGSLQIKNLLGGVSDYEESDSYGSITWPFDQSNLLLDLPHKQIFGVSKEKDLKTLGFDINKMIKIKCNISNNSITFPAKVLDKHLIIHLITESTLNLINSELLNGNERLFEQVFSKEKNLGKVNFFSTEISKELGVDAILGFDFLQNHTVYFDAKNQYLYIGDRSSCIISGNTSKKIPIQFTDDGLPVVDICLGKEKRKAKIDLGNVCEMIVLSGKNDLRNLRILGESSSFNIYGEEEKGQCYFLPQLEMEGIKIKNIVAHSMNKVGVSLDLSFDDLGKIQNKGLCTIGNPILRRSNIYFDFPNSRMHFTVKKDFTASEKFEKVPFELGNGLLILNIKTDFGLFKCAVDTGATVSIIRKNLIEGSMLTSDKFGNACYSSSQFLIGGYDYGGQNFYPLELSEKITSFDTILGMDFFRKHAFYIDFPNRFIYFEK